MTDLPEDQEPLPDWIVREAVRRRDEMQRDPKCRISHEEVWQRIARGRRSSPLEDDTELNP